MHKLHVHKRIQQRRKRKKNTLTIFQPQKIENRREKKNENESVKKKEG